MGNDIFMEKNCSNLFIKKESDRFRRDVLQTIKDSDFFGVPKIGKIIEDGDKIIVVEEYIAGKTLQELIDEHHSFSLNEIKSIVIELCEILEQFHNLNPPIIHRDIKPDNIIWENNHLYLLDFDASKFIDETKNYDTVLLGTKGFAAPEQYGFKQSDERTDIYAIGVLINVLETGEIPNCKITNGLFKDIVNKATSMNPDDRYQRIDQLKRACKFINEYKSEPKEKIDFTPPGFRSGKLLNKVIGMFGYLMVLYFFVLAFLNKNHLDDIMYSGIAILTLILVGVNCNYLQVKDKHMINESYSKKKRVLTMVLWNFVIVFIWLLIIGIIL
ncbi:MAG: protein kinase [Bacilli bacterium]